MAGKNEFHQESCFEATVMGLVCWLTQYRTTCILSAISRGVRWRSRGWPDTYARPDRVLTRDSSSSNQHLITCPMNWASLAKVFGQNVMHLHQGTALPAYSTARTLKMHVTFLASAADPCLLQKECLFWNISRTHVFLCHETFWQLRLCQIKGFIQSLFERLEWRCIFSKINLETGGLKAVFSLSVTFLVTQLNSLLHFPTLSHHSSISAPELQDLGRRQVIFLIVQGFFPIPITSSKTNCVTLALPCGPSFSIASLDSQRPYETFIKEGRKWDLPDGFEGGAEFLW